jgi:hypothetical protein
MLPAHSRAHLPVAPGQWAPSSTVSRRLRRRTSTRHPKAPDCYALRGAERGVALLGLGPADQPPPYASAFITTAVCVRDAGTGCSTRMAAQVRPLPPVGRSQPDGLRDVAPARIRLAFEATEVDGCDRKAGVI